MANQMIALQARAPQTDIIGGAIQRNAQVINMMSQQAAAQRQAAQAQQAMDLAKAKETREIEAANLDKLSKVGAYFRDALASWVQFGDVTAAQALRDDVVKMVPGMEKVIPSAQTLATNREAYNQAYMTADQLANKRFGTATTSTVVNPDTNQVSTVNASGLPGASFSQPVPDISRPVPGAQTPSMQNAAAPTPPAAPSKFGQAFAGGIPASPEQIDAAARALSGGANISDPALRDLSPNDFTAAQQRASRMTLEKPISMTQAQPDLASIVQTMMDTGVVSQSGVEAMRAAAGPGKDAQLAQLLQANNIRVMPDEQGPGMRSAVYRPDQDAVPFQRAIQGGEAPGLTQAQYDPNAYQPTRAKSPMQSPMPGSAIVPIDRVRAEAQAGRESPQEAAARTAATAAAQADADFKKQQQQLQPARQRVTTILNKIGGAYEALEKTSSIPSEKRGGFANFFDYLATSAPGREAQRMVGTEASKHLSQITNLRKQLATAIKNATGMSAQEMNSNVELTLMLDSLSDPTQGIEAARQTLADVQELYGNKAPAPAPAAAPARGAKKRLRYNPATGDFE